MNNNYTMTEWAHVRERVALVDPELANIIDQDTELHHYPLVTVAYPYANHVVCNGKFSLPYSGKAPRRRSYTPFNSELDKLLNYNWSAIPCGLVLSGMLESYWDSSRNIIPMNVLTPGSTFALRTVFDSNNWCNFDRAWNLTSGSRLLFTLSSLKDNNRLKKLNKDLLIKAKVPGSFDEHWHFFKEISRSPCFEHQWNTELLLFTTPWIDTIFAKRSLVLSNYLLSKLWLIKEFDSNRRAFDYVWEEFTYHALNHGYNYKPNIYDYVKHILAVAVGNEFAFRPVIPSDDIGPIGDFSNILLEKYKSNIAPVFMRADKITWPEKNSLYFSIQKVTGLHSHIKSSTNSRLDDIREVAMLVKFFINCIKDNSLALFDDTRFIKLMDQIEFGFYHTDGDYDESIKTSRELFERDSRFYGNNQLNNELQLAEKSKFFNGCVRISKI